MKVAIRSVWCLAFLIAFLSLSAVRGVNAQADPALGTWKLNLTKSTYESSPPPKSETRTYEPSGTDGVKATFNRIDAAGKSVTITYVARYDGRDYAYSGSPDADTIALTRIDVRTIGTILKKNGRIVQDTKVITSPDGSMRTQTSTGVDARGRNFTNVMVFDRQ